MNRYANASPKQGEGVFDAVPIAGGRLIPGRNVDRIDIDAGLAELKACGYSDERTTMVVDFALARWRRGEEAAAERLATDSDFYGIDFTCWRRVLAAALAKAVQP